LKIRAAAIQNEVITSHKKNVEIDWNWSELLDKEDCEELAKVIINTSLLTFFILKIYFYRILNFKKVNAKL
jgi:hypothetical protein